MVPRPAMKCGGDPSDPEIVQVATGESRVRNSVSVGNGVHRTRGLGATWESGP